MGIYRSYCLMAAEYTLFKRSLHETFIKMYCLLDYKANFMAISSDKLCVIHFLTTMQLS